MIPIRLPSENPRAIRPSGMKVNGLAAWSKYSAWTAVAVRETGSTSTKPVISSFSGSWIDSSSREPSRDQTGNVVCRGFSTVATVNCSPVDGLLSRTRSWSASTNLMNGFSATHLPSGDGTACSAVPTWRKFPDRSRR
nr:hypothetical protein GCM10020093_103140 [Planobispora longispora]